MRLFVSFFLVFTCNLTEGKKCIQHGPCMCTFDDGSGTVDLAQMGRQDGMPLMQDQFAPDNYAYSFNPCFPFIEGTCVNAARETVLFRLTKLLKESKGKQFGRGGWVAKFVAAVFVDIDIKENITACQYDSANSIYYNIGDSSKVTLSYDRVNVIGNYVSDDGARSSFVTFVCDQNADPPSYTAEGETSTTVYGFTVTSKYACPSFPPTQTPTPTPRERCFTNFGDFTKTCSSSYDGNAGEIKVLIIEDWDGSCKFPANVDVAVSLHDTTSSCDDVISRCNPQQAFSVNGYVCKGITDQREINSTGDQDLVG